MQGSPGIKYSSDKNKDRLHGKPNENPGCINFWFINIIVFIPLSLYEDNQKKRIQRWLNCIYGPFHFQTSRKIHFQSKILYFISSFIPIIYETILNIKQNNAVAPSCKNRNCQYLFHWKLCWLNIKIVLHCKTWQK